MVLTLPASGLSPLTSFGKKEEKTRFSKREKPPTSRTETSAHILFLVAKREPSLAGSVWYEGKHTSRRYINTRMLTALQHRPNVPYTEIRLEPKHTFFAPCNARRSDPFRQKPLPSLSPTVSYSPGISGFVSQTSYGRSSDFLTETASSQASFALR